MPRATLQINKNQLIFPATAVGLRPSAGRRFHNKYKYLFCSAPTAVIFTAFLGLFTLNFLQVFAPDNSYAATHTDEASGKYNNTEYSLTTTVSDLNLELTTLPTGTSSTYGSQTVNVKTNAPGGYILYMSTSGDLTNSNTSSDDKISSITGNNAALDTNTWGYTSDSLLSSASTALNTNPNEASEQSIWNKLPVSTDTSLTSVTSSSSATENDGENSTLYYGIKADSSLDDGDYQGTITYTTIANDTATDTLLSVSPTSGTAGTATTITITTSLMTTTSSISTSDITAKVGNYTCSSVSITSTAPLKFTCKTSTSLTANTYTVTATISKYGKTYTKTSAYEAKVPDDLSTITNMQTSNVAAKCKNSKETTSTSDVTTYELTDTRNSQKYYIRKFTSGTTGYCIMVENLYLEGGTKLTSADSNVSSDYTLHSSSNTGFSSDTTDSMYNGGASVSTARKRNGATYDGSYYSWLAATAKTGSDSGYDICPKYWRLFTYGEASTIQTMVSNAGITTFYADASGAAASAILPGYYVSSGRYANGSSAYWWSSTLFDSTHAYYLYSDASGLKSTNRNSKRFGYSVRCLVQAAS